MDRTSLSRIALVAGLAALAESGREHPIVSIRRDRDGDPRPVMVGPPKTHGARGFDPAKRRAKNKAAKLARKKNRR